MKKSVVLACAILASALSVQAAEQKLKVVTGTVHFSKADPGPQGYLALPEKTEGKRAGLILIQEWWGLNDWIRQNAERYAAMGYVVVAPDLYRGKSTTDADEAHQLMRGLPEDRAMGDIQAAFDYLASRNDVDPKRIGIAGWCMGGGYALAFGVQEPRLGALIINYGRLITDPATIAKIKAPVQGNFGGTDKGIPADDVKEFAKTLASTNRSTDFLVFDGAGHAFMNPNNSHGYDESSAAKAWSRMDSFLAKHLAAK